MSRQTYCSCSCNLGSLVAGLLSYAINESILWAILHGILGWFYVVYWILSHTRGFEWIKELVIK